MRGFFLFAILSFIGCSEEDISTRTYKCENTQTSDLTSDSLLVVRGALVSTRFKSFEELKKVIKIEYYDDEVRLSHCSCGKEVKSILKTGVSENDFIAARDGGVLERIELMIKSPYAVRYREELKMIAFLSRRREDLFGEGDPAFYDLSEEMLRNINMVDSNCLRMVDMNSEKGYFNTINHLIGQIFMTSMFSEELADFVADSHERKNMPELISGNFSEDQIADLFTGPVDNYVDILNNEWAQEIGKSLQKKHNINPTTIWTSNLLLIFLNDIQLYLEYSFQLQFTPFKIENEIILKFNRKINRLQKDLK